MVTRFADQRSLVAPPPPKLPKVESWGPTLLRRCSLCMGAPFILTVKNVVVQANEPLMLALPYKRVYSFFFFLLPARRKLVEGVFKVKVRVECSRDLSELEQFWKLGNDPADSVAKHSLVRHPQSDPCDILWHDRCLSIAKCAMRLSAELMPMWPRLDLNGVPLVPKRPNPKVDPLPHLWVR
eukprot:4093466-Pyramimonas_sp.AAC.1